MEDEGTGAGGMGAGPVRGDEDMGTGVATRGGAGGGNEGEEGIDMDTSDGCESSEGFRAALINDRMDPGLGASEREGMSDDDMGTDGSGSVGVAKLVEIILGFLAM